MATDIVIPSLGESISEGVIASWLKSDGDTVERDEAILELETDKITMEVPAPAAGKLSTSAGEGDTVAVGDKVGEIDESAAAEKSESKPSFGGGAKQADQEDKQKDKKQPQKQDGEQESGRDRQKAGKEAGAQADASSGDGKAASAPESTDRMPGPDAHRNGPAGATEDVRATPLARKIAEEKGVDLSRVEATGAGGRIREQDVLSFIEQGESGGGTATQAAPARTAARQEQKSAPQPERDGSGVRRERMTQLRQRIAERLVEAQHTAAMLTTFNECDMTEVMALRSEYKDAFEKKHGVKLGFMSFFVKACVNAAERHPRVNAFIVEGEKGPEIEHHDYCDIAIAVSTPKGLTVPVLRGCEQRSFAEVETGILDLAEKARDGKLAMEDLQGGTFTITNGGIYGSMLSTPILNPPQSGILGMHNIIRRPVEDPDKPGSGEVVVRPMMYIALSYDHRIVDGAEAVGYLKRIKECIEDPQRLLMDI